MNVMENMPVRFVLMLRYFTINILFLDCVPLTTSQQDEMEHAGYGCLLSALRGHDLLLHMAVQAAKAEDR